jgi:hypothetical protein
MASDRSLTLEVGLPSINPCSKLKTIGLATTTERKTWSPSPSLAAAMPKSFWEIVMIAIDAMPAGTINSLGLRTYWNVWCPLYAIMELQQRSRRTPSPLPPKSKVLWTHSTPKLLGSLSTRET